MFTVFSKTSFVVGFQLFFRQLADNSIYAAMRTQRAIIPVWLRTARCVAPVVDMKWIEGSDAVVATDEGVPGNGIFNISSRHEADDGDRIVAAVHPVEDLSALRAGGCWMLTTVAASSLCFTPVRDLARLLTLWTHSQILVAGGVGFEPFVVEFFDFHGGRICVVLMGPSNKNCVTDQDDAPGVLAFLAGRSNTISSPQRRT